MSYIAPFSTNAISLLFVRRFQNSCINNNTPSVGPNLFLTHKSKGLNECLLLGTLLLLVLPALLL